MTAKAPAKPRLSGFCNRTLPRTTAYDPHQRCPGCDCRATGCPCNPEETPVPEPTPPNVLTDLHVLAVPETTQPLGPEAAVEAAVDVAGTVNNALAGYGPSDWRDAVRLLYRLRAAIDLLRKVDGNVVTWLYLHGEHGQHQILDGISGEFYIGRGREKERWESEQAVRDYVDAKLMDAEGEVPDHETLISWVLEVLPATASTAPRRTPLKAVGLDPRRYVEDEPGTIKVDLPRPTY